jgi:hypothetical protein
MPRYTSSQRSRFLCVSACTLVLAVSAAGCGSSNASTPPASKVCDAECQDEIVTRCLREMVKLAFNLTLQGKPVGDHDLMVRCPLGGWVRVLGNATSNANQGATNVDLTYTFDSCKYLSKDNEPEENYELTVSGSVKERGTIAVQPTATTALAFESADLFASGNVYNPPMSVKAEMCPLLLQQTGNKLAGTLCSRKVAVDL